MNHIKLFERFESDILSRVFRFVKDKKQLLSDLHTICKNYNIPLSEIKNDSFEMVKFQTGLKDKDNNTIKLWFSSEGKYLGATKFETSTLGKRFKGRTQIANNFHHLEKAKIIFPSGTKPVDGIIYISNGSYFFIHNGIGHMGGRPNDLDWQKYGMKSWNISGTDYQGIYKINPSDDPYDYNAPYLEKDHDLKSIIADADFCVLFKIPTDLKKLSDIKSSRSGRSKRMSPSEIKNKNLENYISKLAGSKDLKTDKLRTILKRCLAYEYPVIAMKTINIDTFTNEIIDAFFLTIKGSYSHKDLLNVLNKNYKYGILLSSKSREVINELVLELKSRKQSDNNKLEFVNLFIELNKKCADWIYSKEIKNIKEIDSFHQRIKYVYNLIFVVRYHTVKKNSINKFITDLSDYTKEKTKESMDRFIGRIPSLPGELENMKILIDSIP